MLTAENNCSCIPPVKVGEHASTGNVPVCVSFPVKFVVAIILQIICSYNERYSSWGEVTSMKG